MFGYALQDGADVLVLAYIHSELVPMRCWLLPCRAVIILRGDWDGLRRCGMYTIDKSLMKFFGVCDWVGVLVMLFCSFFV